MAVSGGQPQGVGGTRSFLPPVEGMRACAAVGVVVTHVAFQTGHTGGVAGRLFGRFDLAVAVFFALSGFLLWRGHAAAARGMRPIPATGHYLRSRLIRIMPAYLVAVVVILTPAARREGRPDRLAGQPVADPDLRAVDADRRADPDVEPGRRGELLPGVARDRAAGAAGRRAGANPRAGRRGRIEPGLGPHPVRHPVGVSSVNWPPAFLSWFVAGMLLAELTVSPVGWPHRLARRRIVMAVVAVVAFLVAASPVAGPGRPHARHRARSSS